MPPIFLTTNRKLLETSSGSELTRSRKISEFSFAIKSFFFFKNCYTFAFINVYFILNKSHPWENDKLHPRV